MTSRLIPARFAGKCRVCGKAVAAGDKVWFAKHYGVRCEACGAHTAQDAPLPSKRGAKARTPFRPSPSIPAGGANNGDHRADRCADGTTRFEFDSVTEAVEDALDDYAQNDTNREKIRGQMAAALSGRSAWGNHFTKDRLLAELANPNKSLLEAVDRMREKLMGEVPIRTAPRRKIRRGQESGEELDSDRWLARVPECWDRNVREPQPKHTVTIGCNLSISGSMTADRLLYRGAAALALADILATQGYSVGITLYHAARGVTTTSGLSLQKYNVKSPDMPLDISSIAFAMCEIAWFRVVAVLGGARHFDGILHDGLGTVTRMPAADAKDVDFLIDADVLNEQAAVSWLQGVLNQVLPAESNEKEFARE